MNYPIVIHKDKHSDYGVIVPDLPGCFSAGRTIDEALAMAGEAIELHLEGMIEDGQIVPRPRPIEEHRRCADYAGGLWAVVSINLSNLRLKAKRINVTMPERILDAVDRFARAEHETRSGLLVKAAAAYIRTGEADAARGQDKGDVAEAGRRRAKGPSRPYSRLRRKLGLK